ncbi:FCD domain-containing protein [Streptomyces sp. SudanB182_2057]|uniref:FCD domain-containing protein n=1 Tax=Streptomyces sp. SudanB182_2057 TaxID=3035281 RepID=UPI003F565BA3
MLAEHEAIYNALCARDQLLAQASAIVHVTTSEVRLRSVLAGSSDPPPRTDTARVIDAVT